MSAVLFGVVKDVKDPDKLGRVQVRLLDFSGDVTLPWLRVVNPLASKDFGAMCLPEIEDHVVVLLGPGGVDGMIVIGSVYSGKHKPGALGAGKAGDPLVRGIQTKAGNQIVIDDTAGKESVTVQTKDGKVQLLLDGKGTKLAIVGKTEVSVTSDTKVVVKAKTVEITGQSEIKISAGSAKLSIEGGQVEVKGKMIKIGGGMVELG